MSKKFIPSKYQQSFYDFIKYGVGNCVISAVAGSGKTTTAVSAMKLIKPSEKVLFLAFNKSIVNELENRLDGYENITVKTTHSLGYGILSRNYYPTNKLTIDELKYKKKIEEYVDINNVFTNKNKRKSYIKTIYELCDLSRLFLCTNRHEVYNIARKYGYSIEKEECDVVIGMLTWGRNSLETVDFVDMLWLPNELSLSPRGLTYDWVFIDECQDLSIASSKLFQKCIKRGGRFVGIGDKNQAINQFAGSSEIAFDALANSRNTITMPLPICYRCDKQITKLAREYVPEIVSRDDADYGIVNKNVYLSSLKDGDLVLSRYKGTLVRTYINLLNKGVKCYILGKDNNDSLLEVVENCESEELHPTLDEYGIISELYQNLFSTIDNMIDNMQMSIEEAIDAKTVLEQIDIIETLTILCEGITTKDELVEKIRTIFDVEEKGVCLTTIHKSKGLEADNVYILCHSKLNKPESDKEWEIEQERNLVYVAYTRAKHILGFMNEKETPPLGSDLAVVDIVKKLDSIRMKIENKSLYEKPSPEEAIMFNKNDLFKNNEQEVDNEQKLLNELEEIFRMKKD